MKKKNSKKNAAQAPVEKDHQLLADDILECVAKFEGENMEGKILHPSLDIRDNLLVLGFRYRASLKEHKNIFLVVKDNNLTLTEKTEIQVEKSGAKEMYFMDLRNRKLILIEERWSRKDLYKFFDDHRDANSTAPKASEVASLIWDLANKYIDLEKEVDYFLLSAWAVGTYFSPIFSAYPFLNIKAPKGSGKSQCLNLLRQICFNAIKSRATVAALGDTVDALRGTFLIDQADSLGKKGGEELLDILADSYKRSGGKRRVMNIGKGSREILEFETYGPKAFASIKELPEDLRDRCLIVSLIKSSKNFYDPDDDFEKWNETRGMLYKFLIENFSVVSSIYQVGKIKYKDNLETVGRKLELWLPIEVVFEILGWGKMIEEAKNRFFDAYGYAEYEPSEVEAAVISTINEQFTEIDKIVLSPKEIVEKIEPVERQIFSFAKNDKQKASSVGWAIRKFNLSSKKNKQTRHGVSYLFEKEKVAKIFDNYFEKDTTPPTLEQENDININEIPM